MDGYIKPKKKSFKCRATELTATPYLFNLKAMTDCCLNETCCIVSPSSFFLFFKDLITHNEVDLRYWIKWEYCD